jgi:DNA-binding transcriptional ArsR family regulator
MSTNKSVKPLTEDELGRLAGRFKLLGEPMRLKILQSVCHEPRMVGEIVKATGSTQANVSKHLALLAAAGILKREKDGQCVYYGMKDKLVVRLCELVRAQIAEK